ncbi:prominin-2 [Cololabis saira]|uniref:prominin-2 n=1 Tax=Cololabis saira TaxID=129043 RepID=UPI002AD32ADA|nr:prominin-2 [Cololabis saira]
MVRLMKMALCESMGSGGWRCRAGGLGGAVGLMLLGFIFIQSVHPGAACSAALAPKNFTPPQYQATAKENPGVGFLAALVQSFLNTVQPNPFPQDLILKIVDQSKQTESQDIIKEALVYQVGFLVCVAIGVLYIILMPIVGFILACCRCCGNCGGKMYQKQTSSIHCRRRTLYIFAFSTTIIIFAGNICMFRSNDALKASVDQSPGEINNILGNIHTFLTAVPQQVDYVVNESNKTVQEVVRNLDAIGPQLGAEIQQRFKGPLDIALHSVRLLDGETVNTSVELGKLNSSLNHLQSSMDRLHGNVTAVRNQINQTLSDPNCIGCADLRPQLDKLTLDTSVSVPSVNEFQTAVDEVIKTDLKAKISQVEEYFQSIPERVTNDTQDIVQNSKKSLGDVLEQISQVSSEIHLSALDDVSVTLNEVQREIDKFLPTIKMAEHTRWGVCVALCCVVLLVVVCNLLGLLFGPLGLRSKADPTKRSCTADCGGTFLLMGAGFCFLFSWLFMIAVLLLFLLGGNVYTLVCRPWNNGQLLKFIDIPGLIPGLEIGPSLGLKTSINISDIYRDCEKNHPLWTTLHLYELVDLEELLNISKYTEQIQQQFEDTDITLSSLTLLSPEVQNQLRNISSKLDKLDTAAVTEQMNNISRIDLNTTANKLVTLAGYQADNEIKNQLHDEAMKLRQIQDEIDTVIIPQLENLNSSIRSLQSTAEKINGTVGEVLSNVGAAQDFLNTNTTQIVKTESRKFLDCQLDYFTVYADWANLTITQQVGRCEPVARAVDSAEVVLCTNMVEALNAFWFSLGWCMIFFIPSIIFSIKLAKHYRKMKYSDAKESHIGMNHIPRARMK